MSVCSVPDKTAYHTWSPSGSSLAFGTAAQQLDSNFSTNSELSVHNLDFSAGIGFQESNTTVVDKKFNSLIYTHGNLIVGGHSNGSISIYDGNGNFKHTIEQAHTGSTRTIDCNRFKSNLICTGGSDSEVYIWDLESVSKVSNGQSIATDPKPMAPGAKTQPYTPVSAVSWNYQVEHILASGSGAQGGGISPCTVWDLRKNQPIINVQDGTGRVQCSSLAWNPSVATQIAIASEDDQCPVVQLWDLRMAQSPLKSLSNFQKGVIDISFCPFDDRLMLSISRDNMLRVFNFPEGECVYEQQLISQWPFSAKWCTNRNTPDLISISSFEGCLDVYSIQGSGTIKAESKSGNDKSQMPKNDAISDAFGSFAASAAPTPALQEDTSQKNLTSNEIPVSKIKIHPKWLSHARARCKFGFGGKIVTIKHRNKIELKQLSADNLLKERALDLIEALKSEESLKEFCLKNGEHNSFWKYLGARLSGNDKLIHELGYDKENVTYHLNKILEQKRRCEPINAEDLSRRLSSALRASPNDDEDRNLPTTIGRGFLRVIFVKDLCVTNVH